MNRIPGLLATVACLLLQVTVFAQEPLWHLEIGDPDRKDSLVAVQLDGITDTATGAIVSPAEMAARMVDTGLLFIGENHTSMAFHTAQFRAIRALHDSGREVMIGLEMFPYTQQSSLDDWNNGLLTEEGFIELVGWYKYWGYHWNYYRDIFLYARDNGIRLYAINTPRAIVTAVRKKGFSELTEEEASHLPGEVDISSKDHKRLYRAYFDEDDTLHMTDEVLEGMYRAQATWDSTMGWNAVKALEKHGGPDAIMAVLIGAGHVTYGLGSERQIGPYYSGKISSLIPVPVADSDGVPVETVRASYANFVWGIPPEVEPLYPSVGVSLMGSLGDQPGQIIQVSKESVGGRAGLQVGDVLVSLDGSVLDSTNGLRRIMAKYRWGDVATALVRRDGEEFNIAMPFRRVSPNKK